MENSFSSIHTTRTAETMRHFWFTTLWAISNAWFAQGIMGTTLVGSGMGMSSFR